jgi:hypothetical protein
MKVSIEDFDIRSYLDSRSIPHSPSGKNVSSGWIGINCLFCIDPSNHLGINLNSKAFSCLKCGEHGPAVKLVQTIEGIQNFKKIYEIIGEFSGGTFVPKAKEYQSKVVFPPGTSKNFGIIHTSFLESRGYGPWTVEKYGLYATGPVGEYKHRIIVPIFINGRVQCFVGRDVTGKASVSYLNSPPEKSIRDVKQCLYNMDLVPRKAVVIVEGILDSWRIGDGAVATFGVKYTHEQILLLRGMKRVFVLFDGESEAIKMAHKMAYDLSSIIPEVKVLELSEGDPDNLKEDDVRALRKDLNL